MNIRHPVICKIVLSPVVGILDYVDWRAGGAAPDPGPTPLPDGVLTWDGSPILWAGNYLTWSA